MEKQLLFPLLLIIVHLGACQRKTLSPVPRTAERTAARLQVKARPLKPYPDKWKSHARQNNEFTCAHLVYKRGCSELRLGVVTLGIRLRPDGRVLGLKTVSNSAKVDPGLLAACTEKEIRRWRFKPPRGVSSRLRMEFHFADKCPPVKSRKF